MEEKNKTELTLHANDVVLSAAGALVGYAIGGPAGAVVSGAFSPTAKLALQVGKIWFERCRTRLINIMEHAFACSGKSENVILQEFLDCPDWCDTVMSMIRQLISSDPKLDFLFSEIIASTLSTNNENERRRLIVLSKSLEGMNEVQLYILKCISQAGGTLSACDMASQLEIPEMELRNAVRDLELRGMIADNGEEPIVWKLRELGIAVVNVIETINEKEK